MRSCRDRGCSNIKLHTVGQNKSYLPVRSRSLVMCHPHQWGVIVKVRKKNLTQYSQRELIRNKNSILVNCMQSVH